LYLIITAFVVFLFYTVLRARIATCSLSILVFIIAIKLTLLHDTSYVHEIKDCFATRRAFNHERCYLQDMDMEMFQWDVIPPQGTATLIIEKSLKIHERGVRKYCNAAGSVSLWIGGVLRWASGKNLMLPLKETLFIAA